MATTFYVKFGDSSASAADQNHILWTHFFSAAHSIVALALFLSSIVFIVKAHKTKQPDFRMAAWIGFIAIVIAAMSGSSFVTSQNDTYSFIMSLGFILAFVTYGWAALRPNAE